MAWGMERLLGIRNGRDLGGQVVEPDQDCNRLSTPEGVVAALVERWNGDDTNGNGQLEVEGTCVTGDDGRKVDLGAIADALVGVDESFRQYVIKGLPVGILGVREIRVWCGGGGVTVRGRCGKNGSENDWMWTCNGENIGRGVLAMTKFSPVDKEASMGRGLDGNGGLGQGR